MENLVCCLLCSNGTPILYYPISGNTNLANSHTITAHYYWQWHEPLNSKHEKNLHQLHSAVQVDQKLPTSFVTTDIRYFETLNSNWVRLNTAFQVITNYNINED